MTTWQPSHRNLRESFWEADLSVPALRQTVGGLLRETTRAADRRPALVAGLDSIPRRRWTYAELLNDAEGVATALLEHFSPGERLAISAPNCPEWVIVQLGAALAGLTLIPLNTSYAPAELVYILEQSRTAGIVLAPNSALTQQMAELRPQLPQLREIFVLTADSTLWQRSGVDVHLPSVDPDSPAIIQYTSGTTGSPKGAVLTHSHVVNNGSLSSQRLGLPPGAAWLNPLPMYHVNGSVFFALGAIAQGATHILAKFDPKLVLDLIEAESATFVTGVPTLLFAMMDHEDFEGRDLASLQLITTGGTTVPAKLITRIEERFGVKVIVIYGQTEAGGVIATTYLDDTIEVKSETVGQPLPQTEVKIIDPVTSKIIDIDSVGEICVRGASVIHEYFEAPDITAATIDPDGWMHTGDLGAMDRLGRLKITGRLKDLIIRGGENIYPRDIEDVLSAHPDIQDVAVLGIPDAYYGEIVCAVVRIRAGRPADQEAWQALVAEHLSRRKVPTRWFRVDAMPVTASGKVQKFRLREQIDRHELPEL